MPSKRNSKTVYPEIITHKRPDFDSIFAVWLLLRFGGYGGAKIKFFSFGDKIPQKYDNAVCVDIGDGEFDHHQRSDLVSASMLVLKSLNLHNNPALHQFAEISVYVDHGLFDRIDKRFLGIIDLIDALNNQYPKRPLKVVKIMFECLDALYHYEDLKIRAEGEFAQAKPFLTKWGKGIAISTTNRLVRSLCHKRNIPIYIYEDPKKGYKGIVAQGGENIDFTDAYDNLKAVEPEAEWYLHFTKDLLICGSDKAYNRHLSSLSLDYLIGLIKIDGR